MPIRRRLTKDLFELKGFHTLDDVKRHLLTMIRAIYGSESSVAIGTSPDKPHFLISDIQLFDDDAIVNLPTITPQYYINHANSIQALIRVDELQFVLLDGDEPKAIMELHESFDRTTIKKFKKHQRSIKREEKLDRIEDLLGEVLAQIKKNRL